MIEEPTAESPPDQVHLYAHWLDSDHSEAALPLDHRSALERHARHIKLLALLGHRLILNDNQLVACPVLARFFADDGFRRFLGQHSDFLEFRVPKEFVSEDTPFRRVTGNLKRILGLDSGRPMVWDRP